MIKSKATESTSGLMVASMRAGGTEANSMELEPTSTARKELSSTESGRTESETGGLTRILLS